MLKGFCIVNKPIGITSFDAIKKIKKHFREEYNIIEKRIGHVGTLDPFADGVLILAFGRYTKLFFLFDDMSKEYIAEGVFGESRDTDDVEGNVLAISDSKNILSFEELDKIIKTNFSGNIIQKPPIYSAKKINGKRAYDMARANEKFELKSVNVCINNIELLEYNYPYFKIKTSVSKGTYIRSIIRDIGIITNNLAYTKSLTRCSIGKYNIDMACNIENISSDNILSFSEMFKDFDNIVIEDKETVKQILCGNTKMIETLEIKNKYLVLNNENNDLIAVITNDSDKRNTYSFINI
ncbi:tRNA pseudouridine(55) synthase TruB [Brachyspira alvinipulli]|uniref:tRNA pseudouridine(55) synthase TruB n=1 Tax=Brachyspira alvinipulli TaxID=84379 RepID=UPI0004BADB06|nr:tRNA pseudouridine(55) synthase TruB [Brachyspira alvinipulli]